MGKGWIGWVASARRAERACLFAGAANASRGRPATPRPRPRPARAQPADAYVERGGVDSKGDGVAATSMLAESADDDLVFA